MGSYAAVEKVMLAISDQLYKKHHLLSNQLSQKMTSPSVEDLVDRFISNFHDVGDAEQP